MKSDLDNRLIAVLRVRGRIGVRRTIKETLERMNIPRVNSLALLFGNESNMGMIKKCNDFVTYGAISEEMLGKVIEKNGVKISKEDVNALMEGSKKPRELMRLPIRLKPPRHGHRSIKSGFSSGGAMGYRGDAMNDLLKRMV